MKHSRTKVILFSVLTVTMLMISNVQGSEREEIDISLTTYRWSTVTSTAPAKTARISSETLFGPAVGLRLNDYLNFNSEVLFGQPDAQVTPGPSTKADVVYVNVGLDYYIKHVDVSCGSLAPYIAGGLGAMNLDQESPNGLSEWPFAYNVGAGLRWNMDGNTFLKVYYRWLWADLKVTNQTELFHGYGISFGFNF